MEYLVDAYGKTDALYPKVLKKRALVNARMYFDATSLYPKLATAYVSGVLYPFLINFIYFYAYSVGRLFTLQPNQ